jgi:hypothetical protein
VVHEELPQGHPCGGVTLDAGDDGLASRKRVATGSARPDATPVVSIRHCSPQLDNCPPACLRYMGSARANRSGRSPGSELKEFDELKPFRAASERYEADVVVEETLRGRGVVGGWCLLFPSVEAGLYCRPTMVCCVAAVCICFRVDWWHQLLPA